MEWKEAILNLHEAQDNNRLVIFVGAGVSKNSQIPGWGELICRIADEIDYPLKEDDEGNKIVSSEEYLRIPEYYYNKDSSDKHEEYYQFIKEALKAENAVPNALDEIILKILPHHIITTNYDALLESTPSINRNYYKVIVKDDDLLKNDNDRYIIKMHGDFSDNESIVLKESDYLYYEQKHPLISTFIKSLLIDHTFLFVGYSLNDINLHLIMGWINYFCEKGSIDRRPQSYLLQSDNKNDYELERLKKKNINVVAGCHAPETINCDAETPDGLKDTYAKQVYVFLKLLEDREYAIKKL